MKDYIDEYIVVTRLLHREKGATVYELADALDKTTRAVYIILNQLEATQFPIWTDQDKDNGKIVRYHADSTFMKSLPDMDFTEDDKAVFNYLLSDLSNNPALETKARHLFTKFKIMASERGALIEKNTGKPLSIVSASNITKRVDNKRTAFVISRIIESIEKKEWMTFDYRNHYKGGSYNYTVYPIVIFSSDGDYYLYVYNRYKQLRMLALERINSVISTEQRDIHIPDVDIKKLLDDPFGIVCDSKPFRIKLLIDKDEAIYVKEKKWPESVKITDNSDGSIIFVAETRSYYDCRKWILQRIMSLTVLEPEWLKEDIKNTIKVGLARYDEK